jgi:hypothetical protein
MKRVFAFEFGDQKWVPKIFRRQLHELLQFQVGLFYQALLPLLKNWIVENKIDQLTDLASGTGGPWHKFLPLIQKEKPNFSLQLSDINPIKNSAIPFIKHSVDLNNPSSWPAGALSIFTAFHHLKKEQIHYLLSKAVEENRPLFIAEFTERSSKRVLGMLFSFIAVWVHSPSVKPFTFTRFLFTYLLPVVPLIYLWDGAVSHLRSFSDQELEQFCTKHSTDHYQLCSFSIPNHTQGMTLRGIYSKKKD